LTPQKKITFSFFHFFFHFFFLDFFFLPLIRPSMSSNGLGGLTGKPPPREDPGHSSAATLAKRVPPKATESKSRAVHPKSKPGKESSKSNAKSTKVATVVPPTYVIRDPLPPPPTAFPLAILFFLLLPLFGSHVR
jgi:hypothetical protein